MEELKRIKIGYKEYDIERTSDVSKVSYDSSVCYGRIDFNERKIYLNETRQEESTLIHEVLHGIDDMYEIGLTEEQVRMLAKGIYIALEDNGLKISQNQESK